MVPVLGRLLLLGVEGPDVVALQTMLGIAADGIFGEHTENAVKVFQAANGLVADGIVGSKTWVALYPAGPVSAPPAIDHNNHKPPCVWITSPNYSSRNGSKITNIVIHHTDSFNLDGTVAWFKNPASQVSAHYVLGLDGSLVQMVHDGDKAWHCYANNAYTIGIEIVHTNSMGHINALQEKILILLVKNLMTEYDIPKANVEKAHGQYPQNDTSCNGSLFGADKTATKAWVDKNL